VRLEVGESVGSCWDVICVLMRSPVPQVTNIRRSESIHRSGGALGRTSWRRGIQNPLVTAGSGGVGGGIVVE